MDNVFHIMQNRTDLQIPLIVNIPHSATFIPNDIRRTFILSDNELHEELIRMTDRYTDELFSSVSKIGGIGIVYKVSRLVVDPERFLDDEKESMSKKGMGVVYVKTSQGKVLRMDLSSEQRKALIARFYTPYHLLLENRVQDCLDEFNRCLIIDSHSFPSNPLPFEDEHKQRPDICIGVSDYHTPLELVKSIKEFCRDQGWSTSVNEPFSDSFVPLKFYKKDKRVQSVMIEINRRLYMDEETGEKKSCFYEVKKQISDLIFVMASNSL